MKDTSYRGYALALTLFVMLSAASNVGVARMYSHGVAHLRATPAIDERDIRVFARPLRLTVGQRYARARLEQHLQGIGYYRLAARERGCYDVAENSLTVWARYPELSNVTIEWTEEVIASLTTPGGESLTEALIEPPSVATMMRDAADTVSRTRLDWVPLAAVATTPLVDAIIASEDRAFREHHGVDFPRLLSVPFAGGGASTITMQVARLNVLGDRRRTFERKANEIGVAMAMERVHSKDTILSAYFNTVDLGARRGRPVHGFGAAAREFFGIRDLREVTPLEAATLAALLNQPSRYLDELHDGDESRLQRQRNRVLRLMRKNFPDRYSEDWLRRLEPEPVRLAPPSSGDDALDRVSRHFMDYALAGVSVDAPSRVYLTLDARLQQAATDAVSRGLADLEQRLSLSSRRPLQAALLAIDPRSGEILAMVGGRSYESSQFNRTVSARRQVGSIMKPFDYLAAFERAASEGITDISAATMVLDRPTTFTFPGFASWTPANYDNNYAGEITWRRALAESRNIAAVKVAAWAGFRRVAALWQSASGQTSARAFPSIALGALQATPAEVASAYAMLAGDGVTRPLTAVTKIVSGGAVQVSPVALPQRVARPDSVAKVREMMRAVFDEGTGRGARAAGFREDAAGKTGTTDALRDAWFAGFTRDVLTVVWVGRDDDRPVGLTGAQAALPIWTEFMKRAVSDDPPPTDLEASGRPDQASGRAASPPDVDARAPAGPRRSQARELQHDRSTRQHPPERRAAPAPTTHARPRA